MKKIFIFAALVAAILFSACQSEKFAEPIYDGDFYASVEEFASTRTQMDESRKVLWSDDDRIVIFNKADQGIQYKVKSGGKTTASFTKIESDDFMSPSPLDHVVAYYPYSDIIECARVTKGYSMTVALPVKQIYLQNSFGKGALPMAAITEDANLAFKNVNGAMRLRLKGSIKVASVKVEGKNNEKLSGAATVSVYTDGSMPRIEMESDAFAYVTLDCGDGVQLSNEETTDFIISLPPVKFTRGFTVTITDATGVVYTVESNKSTNEIIRSSILKMPEMTLGLSHREPMEGDYIDEYGVNHGQGVEIDGIVWAPVNCGYHETDFKYGKLYQWGRKYGQGYDDSQNPYGSYLDMVDTVVPSLVETEGVSVVEGNLESNSNIVYSLSIHPYDWVNPHNTLLWNLGTDANPKKTEYDPCPAGWRVPTATEMEQLITNPSSETTDNMGQKGLVFVDQEEDSRLFLPAAGMRDFPGKYAESRGSSGFYWSSAAYNQTGYSHRAGYIRVGASASFSSQAYRGRGYSVRCVKDNAEFVEVSSVSLNTASVSLYEGQTTYLSASIIPSNANHKDAFWYSSDESVATVDQTGNVKGVAIGTATITAVAGMQAATCEVTVEERVEYIDENGISRGYGVKIGETIWAPVNCGFHETDYKYGKLYQWGRKYGQGYNHSDAIATETSEGPVSLAVGQSVSNKNYFYGSSSSTKDWLYTPDATLWNLGTEDDPLKTEYDPCPVGWRVPTGKELSDLKSNKSPWATENGQEGYWFSGPQEYSLSVPGVFFPAAGRNNGYSGDGRGEYCYYWTSTSSTKMANALYFYNSSVLVGYSTHEAGYSVRCVKYYGELVEVSSLTLDTPSLMLGEGRSYELSVSIVPSNANHQKASWWSSDETVATVDQTGKLTAVGAGTTIITAMAGMQTATCEVTVRKELQDYVDEYGENHGTGTMIDGVIWAPVNCGFHEADFKYGKLYQWGRKYGQGYEGSDASFPALKEGGVSASDANLKDNENVFYTGISSYGHNWAYPHDSTLWNSGSDSSPLKTDYDPCPTGWRVPTYAELSQLCQNYSDKTTRNGQTGYWLSGTQAYSSSVSRIFMPFAGKINSGGIPCDRDEYGFYWTSYTNQEYIFVSYFLGSQDGMSTTVRSNAYSIRCVQEQYDISFGYE